MSCRFAKIDSAGVAVTYLSYFFDLICCLFSQLCSNLLYYDYIQVFSRLQSHWRLSNQLQCLEQKKVHPLPPALHLPFVATVNSVPYANTIAPPAGLCSAPASLYPFTKHTGSQVTPKSAPGTVSAAAIRSFQRAEAPPLSSFTMDPYRYTLRY